MKWVIALNVLLDINPFQSIVAIHIETSHLFYITNQMAGSYMKRNTRLNWVNAISSLSR